MDESDLFILKQGLIRLAWTVCALVIGVVCLVVLGIVLVFAI